LKDAITPQVKKIESIEESHTGRNVLIGLLFLAIGGAIYVLYNRKKDEEAKAEAEAQQKRDEELAEITRGHLRAAKEREAQEEAERQALRAHKNYGNERFNPTNPDVLLPKKTKAQIKAETEALELREAQTRADAAEADARRARISANYVAPAPAPVVNNHYGSNNSGNDMLTGMLVGNMLSNSGHNHSHSHDTTIIREREVVRETPAPSRSSSWDDTPSTPSRSSSWDDDSSSSSSKSSSSSWSSSSDSSSSSSSWDSGSSSSSSDSSSSSWD